jgi:transposase
MRVLHLAAHLSNKLLQKRLQQQKDIRLFQYWQILYCIQTNPGKQAEEYGSLLGVDVSKIYRIVQLYNRHGADFDKALQWGGRREQRSLLTLREESELMDTFKQKALQGKVITINDIRRIVESKTAQPVSDDYLWDLFKRHGWKKKAPRPQHPQKNIASQQTFKKNSPNYWSPVSKD